MVEYFSTGDTVPVDAMIRAYVRKYHQGYSPENEAEKVAKLLTPVNSRKLQLMFTNLLGREPENILDIGCGTGRFLRGLPSTWKRVGVECRLDVIEIAIRLGDGRLEIQAGFAESLPFDNNTFDIVTSFQVLEHVSDPLRAVQEMFRVTRPGGLVYGELPNKWHPREPHIGLIYPQILPIWLRKPYIDHFGKLNTGSVEFDYLLNINYLTPWQVLAMLRQQASRVIHLTQPRLEERFKKTSFKPIAQLLAILGSKFAGIEFVAIK